MHGTLEKLQLELTGAIAGMSAGETQARQGAGKWSVQQTVEHLLLSYKTTLEVVGARVAKGTATKAEATISQRFGQFAITRLGWFPKGRKAPAAVTPGDRVERCLTGDELAAEVMTSVARMDQALAEAEAVFGDRRAISHVVLGPMSAQQWRRFHLVHGEHHRKQIQAMRG